MPPTSRGARICTGRIAPNVRACSRPYVSIQKPRVPRSPPKQPPPLPSPVRPKIKQDEAIAEEILNERQQTREYKIVDTIVRWWRRPQDQPRWQSPPLLKNRPFLRTSIYTFFIAVPICGFILMHFPIEPRTVTGLSMQPTINGDCESENDPNHNASCVLVQLWNPNRGRELRRSFKEGWLGTYNRGDIVVYHTPHDPDKVAVKRVVGVPGDTVIPLEGYDGGRDPVTVQYYQLWVEGDVNDRKKSIDSNYFGPISEALVRGKVIAIWSPWWNIFNARRPDRKKDEWAAKRQNRVAEGAVYEASVNPDKLGYIELFKAERGDAFLQKIRQNRDYMKDLCEKDDAFGRTMSYYRDRGLKVAKDNNEVEIRERAQEIVDELEKTFGVDALEKSRTRGLQKKRERWRPAENTEDGDEQEAVNHYAVSVTHENEQEAQRQARERPAQAALKQMLEQTRQMAVLKDREMEDRQRKEV